MKPLVTGCVAIQYVNEDSHKGTNKNDEIDVAFSTISSAFNLAPCVRGSELKLC